MTENVANKKSGLSTASMVLGIIGICFSFIPFINVISFILGILAFIFGLIGIITKKGLGQAIAGFVLAILTIAIMFNVNKSATETLSDMVNTFNGDTSQTTEGNKEEEKGQDIELKAGTYIIGEDVKAGKYDVQATKGMGNFFVYGDGALGGIKVNQAFSATESQSQGLFGSTYSNLKLNNGDKIEINSNLVVKLIAK